MRFYTHRHKYYCGIVSTHKHDVHLNHRRGGNDSGAQQSQDRPRGV